MFNLPKAISPPPMNTSNPNNAIARRVRTNARMPLSTIDLLPARDGQHVAEKDRPFGRDQLADLQAFENLPIAVPLVADLHRSPGKAAAVGGDPNRHGAVAFPHHAIERNRDGPHRLADADHEIGEHAGSQFVPRIVDFGTDQNAPGVRVDGRSNGRDLAFEDMIRKGADLDLHILSDAERRAVALG